MRFIDLFCGIGGFHLALARQGHECVFASDYDEQVAARYKDNFGMDAHSDITKVRSEDIPAHDILCGGFPCQDFSVAAIGKESGSQGLSGARGGLFYEIIRIAKHHRPKYMLLENVPRILTINDGADYREINRSLYDAGYRMNAGVLNAAQFSVPQARHRCYFMCWRDDVERPLFHPEPPRTTAPIGDCLDDVESDSEEGRAYIRIQSQSTSPYEPHRVAWMLPECRYEQVTQHDFVLYCARTGKRLNEGAREYATQQDILHAVGFNPRSRERVYDPNYPINTLVTQARDCRVLLADGRVRVLTNKERLRAMGFPDTHIINDGPMGAKQTGNSVCPPVIEALVKEMQCGTGTTLF